MGELELLTAEHAPAVLAFELANRSWFAASISDRGDRYYEHFAVHHAEDLAQQEAGTSAFYVLVQDDLAVIGRFNLRDIDGGVAALGYRVAEHVAGRGVATRAVEELCRDVAPGLGLHTVRAATSDANTASQRVLLRAGFVLMGPARPEEVGGRPGSWYERSVGPR